jgi:hypothetical protein
MPQYLSFEAPDRSTILVEIEPRAPEVGRTGISQEIITTASESFTQALSVIKGCSEVLIDQIKDLSQKATSIEVSFGIKAAGEVGHFVVAKASAEANFVVTLKWDLTTAKPPGTV